MPRIKEFFYEGKIAVHREIHKFHPELNAFLQEKHEAGELEDEAEILAEIGAYCQVSLGGDYTPKDIEGLWDLLFTKLQDMTRKRRVDIITSASTPPESQLELLPTVPPKTEH